MQANPVLRPLEAVGHGILIFLGQNGTRFAHCHFRALKISGSGPTPSNGPHNGYCPHQNNYVPHHTVLTTGTLIVMISILQLQASKHREQICISEEEVQTSSPAHTDSNIITT